MHVGWLKTHILHTYILCGLSCCNTLSYLYNCTYICMYVCMCSICSGLCISCHNFHFHFHFPLLFLFFGLIRFIAHISQPFSHQSRYSSVLRDYNRALKLIFAETHIYINNYLHECIYVSVYVHLDKLHIIL